jgi:hypothetical protein
MGRFSGAKEMGKPFSEGGWTANVFRDVSQPLGKEVFVMSQEVKIYSSPT